MISISIIIPVLNQKQMLEKALESVFNQDSKNYELIVIDGGSEDGTLDVVQQYHQQIQLNIPLYLLLQVL